MNPNKPDGCPRCGWSAIRWQEYKAKQEALERENKKLKEMLKRYLVGEETEEDDGFVEMLK